jgi:hypothetical protein
MLKSLTSTATDPVLDPDYTCIDLGHLEICYARCWRREFNGVGQESVAGVEKGSTRHHVQERETGIPSLVHSGFLPRLKTRVLRSTYIDTTLLRKPDTCQIKSQNHTCRMTKMMNCPKNDSARALPPYSKIPSNIELARPTSAVPRWLNFRESP